VKGQCLVSRWKCERAPAPSIPKWARRAYTAGVATREKSYEDIIYGDLAPGVNFDHFETNVWFEAGREGCKMPQWRTGWRYGDIPEGGRSKNYRDNTLEQGVSLMAIDGQPPIKTLSEFGVKHRPIICVAGWENPLEVGGDGEPLLIGARRIRRRARR